MRNSKLKYKNEKERFHEKVKARNMLRHAVRRGEVLRGVCEICGNIKTEGHHDDYSKPLSVRWLCKFHHSVVHGNVCSSIKPPLTKLNDEIVKYIKNKKDWKRGEIYELSKKLNIHQSAIYKVKSGINWKNVN